MYVSKKNWLFLAIIKRHMPMYLKRHMSVYGLFPKRERGVFGGHRKAYIGAYMACIPKHVIKATHW